MKVTTFDVVPVGGQILRWSPRINPVYTKINDSQEVDVASGMPIGNVAPYGSFRPNENVFWLDRKEAAEAEECYVSYQLGESIKDCATILNGQLYLKARVLRRDELPNQPFH